MASMGADSYTDLLERLFASFEDCHTFAVIENVTAQCQHDLAGQTRPAAHIELLERLARQRLSDLPPTRTDRK